jgi:hypothetical protein
MKPLYAALLACCLVTAALPAAGQLPKLEWHKALYGNKKFNIADIRPDRRGNFYIYGEYNGTIDLDPGPGITTFDESNGRTFFAKYDRQGNLTWARALHADVTQWTTDNTGRIWFVSPVSGTVDFDPGPGTCEITPDGSSYCIGSIGFGGEFTGAFDTKLDKEDVSINGITATVGQIYIAGAFRGDIDADPGTAVRALGSNGLTDAFVAEYNDKGSLLKAFSIGGSGADLATSVTVSPISLFVGGVFSGEVDFDPGLGTKTLHSASAGSGFLVEYESMHGTVWPCNLGKRVSQLSYHSASGNLLVSGLIGDSLDADPGPARTMLYGVKAADFYAISLSSGGALRYAKAIRNEEGPTPGYMTVNANSGLFVAGACKGQLDFNGGSAGGMVSGNGLQDGYVSKYDGNGAYRYAFCIGSHNATTSSSLAISPNGAIYLAGSSTGSVDLDPGRGTAILTGASAYLAGYSDEETLRVPMQTGSPAVEIFNSNRIVYIDFSSCRLVSATINITDIGGKTVLAATHNQADMRRLDLGDLPAGIYMATVTDGESRINRKIVVQ